MGSFPNVESQRDEQTLIKIAQDALLKAEFKPEQSPSDDSSPTINSLDNEEDEVIDPFVEYVELFFDALLAENGPEVLSALKAYELLEVDGEIEDWLMTVSNYYETQKKVVDPIWRLKETVEVEMPYAGTLYVSNMTFIRRGKSE